ncbi:hypothetical protein NIES2107_20300 [Nostoc carneum NIES-2107]|nr:hypothetical protein NIES2107_20300 [Nostoc carneum NIES-2107]
MLNERILLDSRVVISTPTDLKVVDALRYR